MTIDQFLACLRRTTGHEPKPEKPGQWMARCPAHDDGHASLSVGVGDDGRVLIKCMAGCDTSIILERVGLLKRDLFAEKPGDALSGGRQIVATYDYTDAAGQLLYQVVRFAPKDFRQRRPDGNGGWVWNMQGAQRVLYRLQKLAAVSTNVFLTEGEKDADALASIGLVATTTSGGAGKAHKTDLSPLHGRHVCIIADRDEPGRQHAADVAALLDGKAASTRIVEVPDGKDASDYIAALREDGKSDDEIRASIEALQEAARPTQPADWHKPPGRQKKTPEGKAADKTRLVLTDLGNAERFVELFGRDFRYCYDWKCWVCWDGTRWTKQAPELLDQAIHRLARELGRRAFDHDDDDKLRTALKNATRLHSAGGMRAVRDVAQTLPGVGVRQDVFDKQPILLNVLNGTIDLTTGTLRPHAQDDMLSRIAPVEYDPCATCPEWIAFLQRSLPDDPARVRFLQQAAGYSLTGLVSERCMFILYGETKRGKSTFQETIGAMLGDYARTFNVNLLLATKSDAGRSEIAELPGIRFACTAEPSEGKRFDEGKLKSWTGNEKISAEAKYERPFDFFPQFKLWLAANHRPEIRGTDDAVWNRIHLVPFDREIPPDEMVPNLREKLLREAPGILTWAVQGCLDWQRAGSLMTCGAMQKAEHQYRDDCDTFGPFLADCCLIGPICRVSRGDLYKSYVSWAENEGLRVTDAKWFAQKIRERVTGVGEERCHAGRYWTGIGLRREI